MKQFLVFAAVLITGAASAQTITRKAVFTKGQQIEASTTMKMIMTLEMMGQAMEMTNNYKFTSNVNVADVTPQENKFTNTLKRVLIDIQAGPQNMSYDSDKKEDENSEIGQAFSKRINAPINITTDKKGMITSSEDKESAELMEIAGSMGGSMGESMSQVGTSLELIANLPDRQLKTGDTWVDSLTEKKTNSKFVINYRVASIQGNEAQIVYGGTMTRSGEMIQQGMTLNMDLQGLIKGEYTLDPATGLVKNRKMNLDGSGKMEMMGQEIPFKMKMDTNSDLTRK